MPPGPPPADPVLSPCTGWTRAHWEALADRLLDALVPYATPHFAQYRLPGRASSSGPLCDGLEGFARSFLLASFRIAGAGDRADQVAGAMIERYAEGLTTGAAPDGPEAWPRITDRSQPMVEAASIAVALHETRPWIWDRLDPGARQRVVDWLGGFTGRRPWDNNWRLFQVIVGEFLASVGAPHDRAEIEAGLDRIEDWYTGDGWYSDGDGRAFDYYNGWALHLYPLLWARIAGQRAVLDRVTRYRDRLRLFLTGYQHFFGGDGAPVHQGRSLTYRFAAVAPVWMGALAGATPLEPGLTRRLASGVVRHFTERGAPDERGLLTLGWYHPFLPVTQSYSGPASPYWAAKGFLGLLLPPGDPVWTATEVPLPVERADRYTALPAPGWLLHGTRADGVVRLLNHGSDRPVTDGTGPGAPDDDPHYARLAYSSRTAPESGGPARQSRVDNHIALLAPDGAASPRTAIHPIATAGRRAASWYPARLPGDPADHRIETTAALHGRWEIRVHRFQAPPGARLRDGGHAVAGRRPPDAETGDGWALVRRSDGLTCAVIGLYGWERAAVARHTGANALGEHSAVPFLLTAPQPGGTGVLVTLVALTGEPVPVPALRAGTEVTVRPRRDGTEVTVAFPDGGRLVL